MFFLLVQLESQGHSLTETLTGLKWNQLDVLHELNNFREPFRRLKLW